MKISVIMCVKNSMPYLMASINSFERQLFNNKELIIIYSSSNDHSDLFLKSFKDKNIKIFKFNGVIVGILHSDDIFYDEYVLTKIGNIYRQKKPDLIFGNILYSKKNNLLEIKRIWKNINLNNKYELPPHTGTFISKKIYKTIKYNKKYFISGDTDLLIKVLNKKIKFYYLNNYISIMRTGGLSTNFNSLFKKIMEDLDIFKKNKYTILDYLKKITFKINQIFLNKKFKVTNYHRSLNLIPKIKFLDCTEINSINGKIISALNLAFITFNYKFNLRTHKYMFWPDGIFANLILKKKKIPGRKYFLKLLKEINKKPYRYKKIYILGSLPKISQEWLTKQIKQKYVHIDLPYADINKLKSTSNKIKILNNSFIILTLPTPKQELLANHILEANKNCNILCIGGSINILSGLEKASPKLFTSLNLEWLWRLRFDTKRRLSRLIESGYLLSKILLSRNINIF